MAADKQKKIRDLYKKLIDKHLGDDAYDARTGALQPEGNVAKLHNALHTLYHVEQAWLLAGRQSEAKSIEEARDAVSTVIDAINEGKFSDGLSKAEYDAILSALSFVVAAHQQHDNEASLSAERAAPYIPNTGTLAY